MHDLLVMQGDKIVRLTHFWRQQSGVMTPLQADEKPALASLEVFGVLRVQEGNTIRGSFKRDWKRKMEKGWEQEQEKLKKTVKKCKSNIPASSVHLEP